MKATEAQLRANKKYKAANVKYIRIDANVNYDSDILEWLATKPNKAGYIKNLIRADIAKQKGE